MAEGRGRQNGGPGDRLEAEFPLGDGRVQDTADAYCPYCGEAVLVRLDPGGGPNQEYVEDCPVCCRPWTVRLRFASDGSAQVTLSAQDEE